MREVGLGCFAATARGWGCTGQGMCVLHEIPHLGECTRPSSSSPRPSCSTRQAPPGGLWAAKTATSRPPWSKTDPEATCFAHESPPVCDDVVSHPKYPGALVMGNSGGRCEAIWLWGLALYAARETGRYIPIPDAGMQNARDPRPRYWLGGTSSEIAVLGAVIRASADASRIRTARGGLEHQLRLSTADGCIRILGSRRDMVFVCAT